jgi:ferrous iron transport protein A
MVTKFTTGFCAKIASIDDNHPSSKKLINMGLTPNTQMCIVKTAPLGDPVVVKVRNYFLAIRRKDLLALAFEDERVGET